MASEAPQKAKNKRFYEIVVELEKENENGDKGDSSEDSRRHDSTLEEAFLQGEDPVLNKSDSGSEEEWEPPRQRRRSVTRSSAAFQVQPPPTSTPTLTTPPNKKRKTRGGPRSLGVPAQALGQDEEDMWHDITDDDEEPRLPRYSPKRPPGPQLVSSMTYSPLQLFQLFFSTSVVQTLVDNTNKFGEISAAAGKKLKWTEVSVSEFYAFISLIIYMGLVKAKSIADFWSQKQLYQFRYPRSVMSIKRFGAISSNLHLSDPLEDAENMKKKGTPGYDKLFKIKPLYMDILSACRSSFHPKRELAIDERMVASKARNGLKQYMKAKPIKWGYKLFILADSANGYTWNFFVYEGKSALSSGKGLSYDSVMTLLDFSLLGTGYKVYMDNFYTSPTLFSDLLREHTLACGTIRGTNHQGFPCPTRNDLPKRAKRGTIRWYRQGQLLYVKWMDTREVTMCSTIHKAYTGDTVERRVKNEQGVWGTTSVPIPAAVKDYNKHMGGVDLSDALIGYYNVLHKSQKWYKTFFFHFIDIAIVNSFILHQEMAKINGQESLTQKVFREVLVVELADTFKRSSGTAGPPDQSTEDEEPTAGPSNQPAQSEKCMPAFFGTDSTAGRRKCEHCKKKGRQVKTPVYCTECDVPLCLVPSRNCFKEWHETN